MDRLVCGAILEVEGIGTPDISCQEGRAGAVACRDIGGGGVNKADEHAGDIHWSLLPME